VTMSANGRFTVSAVEYNGVTAIGNQNSNNTFTGGTTTATPSITLTTQDANNVCVAGFQENSTLVISSGGAGINLRTQVSDASQIGAILDTTQVAPGTCTVSAMVSAAHTWAVSVVELRSAGAPAVDVIDVTADPSGGTPTLTTVTSIAEPFGSGAFGVGAVPGAPNPRAYVTLPGVNQFDVLDNTVATPVQIAGGPFNLPDPAAAATAVTPEGVAIPPSTATPVQAYITFGATGKVGVIDNNASPSKDAGSPISLTGGAASAPGRLASMPIPR